MLRLPDQERQRIDATLSSIPANVESVLEIGVGDGRMSEPLRSRIPNYVGLDLPRRAIRIAPFNQVFGTIAALPFRDRAFDIVVCCEVLEHLPNEVFRAGLREMQRVASKHVLVTVPYRQKVECELTRCTICGFVGHWTSHVRSFSEDIVRDLIPGWDLGELRTFGPHVRGYAPEWLYRFQYRLGVFRQRPWRCSACRQMSEASRPGLPGRFVQSIIWRVEKRAPMRPAWLLARWSGCGS